MVIYNIGSGSSGNSTLIDDGQTLIQIDAGLGIKKIKDALKVLNKTIDDVAGLFITHSHTDHSANYSLYSKEKRFSHADCLPPDELLSTNVLYPQMKYTLGSLEITPVQLSHDVKCFGYAVHSTLDGETLVNVTDTGYLPENCFSVLTNADYYIFESNHDTDLELTSKRPVYLIKRNMADTGHLNNIDASYYLSMLVGEKTKAIMFAHLSRECNREDLVRKAFEDVFLAQKGTVPGIEIYCLQQSSPTIVKSKVR